MTEYIERKAAIAAIRKVPRGNWDNTRYVHELQGIPAADVVHVIRCAECVYGFPMINGEYTCVTGNANVVDVHGPNYYCASGERNDGRHI